MVAAAIAIMKPTAGAGCVRFSSFTANAAAGPGIILQVNVEAAIDFIAECRRLCDEAVQAKRGNPRDYFPDPSWLAADAAMQARMLALRRLVGEIDPDLPLEIEREYDTMHTAWQRCGDACTRALGVLEHRPHVDAILGPIGPQLRATGLHPWVWEPAAQLWDNGHRKQAIAGAAERVESETRTKTQRFDLQGVSVFSEGWSEKPAQSGLRLRPVGFAPQTPDYDSALEGARLYAMGCSKRIRNLATHNPEEPDEQYALEQLAALSVLARWIDDASTSAT